MRGTSDRGYGGRAVNAVEIPSLQTPLWAGHTVLEGVYSVEALTVAREGQERFYRGETDLRSELAWPKPRRTSARSRKHPYASFFRSELAAIARSPVLAARIAEVTGAKVVRYWHDQLLSEAPRKRKGSADCHWHTERSRWKTCQCPLMVTAWIPLETVTAAMGPISFLAAVEKASPLPEPDNPDLFRSELRLTMRPPQ